MNRVLFSYKDIKMDEETLNWIRHLIAENNVHEFYTSPV